MNIDKQEQKGFGNSLETKDIVIKKPRTTMKFTPTCPDKWIKFAQENDAPGKYHFLYRGRAGYRMPPCVGIVWECCNMGWDADIEGGKTLEESTEDQFAYLTEQLIEGAKSHNCLKDQT